MQSFFIVMILGIGIAIIFLVWLHRREMSKAPPPPPPARRRPENENGPDQNSP
jgi:hypothetical protein